jgi:hypothetical protein
MKKKNPFTVKILQSDPGKINNQQYLEQILSLQRRE